MKRLTLLFFLITALSFGQEQEKKEAPWNVMYPEFMAEEAAEYFDEFNMLWSDESPIEAKEGRLVAIACLLYTSPSPRDVEEARMPSSA